MRQQPYGNKQNSENDGNPMQIEKGKCYLVRSVAGGSVICAKASENTTFPIMKIENGVDLSAKLCKRDVEPLMDFTINLAIAVPHSGNSCDCDNCDGAVTELVEFIERV